MSSEAETIQSGSKTKKGSRSPSPEVDGRDHGPPMRSPYTSDFMEVRSAEIERLKERRRAFFKGGEERDPDVDAVGLALSGGGVRSATFNLGLLQALEHYRLLGYVDYMSTVSGGGYIGSSLTWFRSKHQDEFPFGTRRGDNKTRTGRVLQWLRDHGRYLAPGRGFDVWALAGAVLTGTLVNLGILLPCFLLGFFWLTRDIPALRGPEAALPLGLATHLGHNGFDLLLLLAAVALALFVVFVGSLVAASRFAAPRRFVEVRRVRRKLGFCLKCATWLAIAGCIPIAYRAAADLVAQVSSGISVVGALTLLSGLIKRKPESEAKGGRAFVLALGLMLLVYGLFLWLYAVMRHQVGYLGWIPPRWLDIWAGVSLVAALFAGINHISMHRYYRDRLKDAYMPHNVDGRGYPTRESKEADTFRLRDIPISRAPYQILNTNVQMVDSKQRVYHGRGGDSFVLSELYCGSNATGFRRTDKYVGGGMNLATALAISGAAVDTNTFATRSRPLSFLMTLLNLRLGYWTRNPNPRPAESPETVDSKLREAAEMPKHPGRLSRALEDRVPKATEAAKRGWAATTREVRATTKRLGWYSYMFSEMLGKGLSETRRQIHLSDGGHFENLGLYELVRRRCRYIIVSDASADPDCELGDLGRATELVRADHGAKVDLDARCLEPEDKDTKISKCGYVLGTIEYRDPPSESDSKGGGVAQYGPERGHVIYIKTTLVEGLPSDVYAYREKNPKFPDQSTGDQFFDERQFEAYRELGYRLGQSLFRHMDGKYHPDEKSVDAKPDKPEYRSIDSVEDLKTLFGDKEDGQAKVATS